MLHINNITIRMEGRILIENASFALPPRTRMGLVGRNGTGKSTLFRAITGELSPDAGDVRIRKGARMGAIAQEAPGGPTSILDFVLQADHERAGLLARAETETDPTQIAEIQLRLQDIAAHSAESRASTILAGLRFTTEAQKRPCSDFSGGWRMRAALAAILFASPDLLLLDEPTNYLDLEGAIWLENHLRKYPGSALIVSHDRDLLNASVHRIAHLANKRIRTFEGGYDDFQRLLAEKQRLDMAMMAKQEDQRRHMQAFVDRFRYSAAKAKQAQSRIKLMEKMQPVATLVQNPVAPILIPDPKKAMAPPIIRFEDAKVGYESGKPILSDLNLSIQADDRIGLLGQNGEGKSTFAKLLCGKLQTMEGHKYQHKKLEIAYFAQHQLDVLDQNLTPYDHICELMPDGTEAQRRARLGGFGLGVNHAETKIKDLSGGEKARLLLNLIAFNGPHLLILDEPTNHLDMDSRLALADALDGYSGAILLISHDRSLIERCIERLWLVKDGAVNPYDGDMDEYKQLVLKKDRKRKTKPKPPKKQAVRQQTAQGRADLAPIQRNVARLEREVARLQTGVASIDAVLATQELYDRDPAQVSELNRKRNRALERIKMLEEQCLREMERLEDGG
ncbi:Bis-ABC ATPase YheS [hydrothermal vent metagenome]|uniref:Bis-ABC ATPase YheS n=1 Tax=hydrothermal vent metagenome TaxID=652676 RepID=A0A3B0R9Y0_9ZZZZ